MLSYKQQNIASGATSIRNAGRAPDENILQSNTTSPVQSVDSVRFVDSRLLTPTHYATPHTTSTLSATVDIYPDRIRCGNISGCCVYDVKIRPSDHICWPGTASAALYQKISIPTV